MPEIKRQKISKQEERDILMGMIIDTNFINGINKIYKPELLTLPYARIVAGWCMDYYAEYNKAPLRDIKSIYAIKKNEIHNKDYLENVDIFLDSLSTVFIDEDFSFNTDYEIDKAVKYFKSCSLDLLIDKIKGYKLAGNYEQAEAAVANFKRIEKGLSSGIDLFNDEDSVLSAIRKDEEDIVLSYPGAMGQIIRPITRKDFFLFMAPMGRGKTWELQEAAILGILNNKNVLFISLEMPREQIQMRIYQRLTGEVVSDHSKKEDDNYIVEIPEFDIYYNDNKKVKMRKVKKYGVNARNVIRKMNSLQSLFKINKLWLESFAAGSINVRSGIIPLLDNLAHYNNFIPDIFCLDYPDILAPERGGIEKRHQIDETWRALRGLGQDRNMAIVVPSHTNKATLERDIRPGDNSEDNRKLNHATIAVSINQSEDDVDNKIVRFSVMKDRFHFFSGKNEAVVLRCLDIGKPYVDSRINKKD